VIRIVTAALILLPAVAQARPRISPPPPPPDDVEMPEPPEAPAAPAAPQAPRAPKAPQAPKAPRSLHLNLQIPMPQISEFRFPTAAFEALDQLVGLPEIMADAWSGDAFASDDRGRSERDRARAERDRARAERESDGDEEDEDEAPEKDEHGAHVYRMNQRIVIQKMPRGLNDGDLDRDDFADARDSSAQAKGHGSATLPVKGPVTFQVRAQGGDIEVVSTDRSQVSISLSDAPADDVALYAFGDRIEPSFRGRRLLRRGKLHVELPRGSRLDVTSMSGDISAQRLGDVRIRTLSGDVKLAGVAKTDVQSISGDVHIADASGPVRLHLVSGRATVLTSGTGPQVEFQSASGSLDWGGTCARDCHLSAETVSGELRFAVDPHSSFELSYTSHSGELRDELELAVKHAPRRKHGMASGWLEATFGKGEGVIEADAFSGNLLVKKR